MKIDLSMEDLRNLDYFLDKVPTVGKQERAAMNTIYAKLDQGVKAAQIAQEAKEPDTEEK